MTIQELEKKYNKLIKLTTEKYEEQYLALGFKKVYEFIEYDTKNNPYAKIICLIEQ